MTKELKNYLIGLSLGDGHVRIDGTALQIQHGQNQKEYLEYKTNILNNLSNSDIKINQFDNGGYDGYRIYYNLNKRYLKLIRKWLYPNNKKYITKQILHRLSDREIAIWYMDDGSLYKKKGGSGGIGYELVISTYCETEKEVIGIIDFFKERYGVNFTIKRNKGRYSIRCGKKAALVIFEKIKKYIPKSMSYKLI